MELQIISKYTWEEMVIVASKDLGHYILAFWIKPRNKVTLLKYLKNNVMVFINSTPAEFSCCIL